MTRLTRLHQVAARAGDLDATVDFYREQLGCRFIARFDPPGIAFFDFSGVRVLFEAAAPQTVLYFWVDDIQRAYQDLQSRGINFDSEPHVIHKDAEGIFDNPETEEWMAFFKDPAGNTVALASRVAE